MVTRLILTACFLFIVFFSYSQEEQEILRKAIISYEKELPKLEKQAFKELRELDKYYINTKNSEFKNYHFIIIPMFELKEGYIHYHNGESFAKYLDFGKMLTNLDAYVFKDSVYVGYLHLSDFDNSYSSVRDTNKFNKPAFIGHLELVSQIQKFKADMEFYPGCRTFMCFIKEEKLYIGRWAKQSTTLDYILPAEEFIKTNPFFIKELQSDPTTGINRHH